MHLVERCSSMHAIAHYTVNLHPAGMRLEWSDPPSLASPLCVQTSAKGMSRSTYTHGNTHWLCGSVVSKGAFQMAWKPELLSLHSGWTGWTGRSICPRLAFLIDSSWIRRLSLCLIDELYLQFPDMSNFWFWVGSGWNSDVLCMGERYFTVWRVKSDPFIQTAVAG